MALRNNRQAFERIKLRPRMPVGVSGRKLDCLHCCAMGMYSVREALIKFVTPAHAGVQAIENTGFRRAPE